MKKFKRLKKDYLKNSFMIPCKYFEVSDINDIEGERYIKLTGIGLYEFFKSVESFLYDISDSKDEMKIINFIKDVPKLNGIIYNIISSLNYYRRKAQEKKK